jgi:hypothetical protein
MVFIFSLNFAALTLQQFGVLGTSVKLWIGPLDLFNPATNMGVFSLVVFGALAGGGVLMGLAALITRQYVYAAGAILIWVVGILSGIGAWLLAGVPIMLNALLPVEVQWVSYVVVAFFALSFFMFLVEVASQRYIT